MSNDAGAKCGAAQSKGLSIGKTLKLQPRNGLSAPEPRSSGVVFRAEVSFVRWAAACQRAQSYCRYRQFS
jgi:hypothetical protein